MPIFLKTFNLGLKNVVLIKKSVLQTDYPMNLGLWSYVDSCQSEHEKSKCRLLSSWNHHGTRNLQSVGGTVPDLKRHRNVIFIFTKLILSFLLSYYRN